MDARRALPLLLLVICIINAAFAIQNGWSGPNNIRRVRRISEYLVPPPPPRFHPPGRIPRLANLQPIEEPGYFAQMISWLNPFGSGSSSQPRPPPPLPSQPKAPRFIQPTPLPPESPATFYNPSPVDYEKPPLPPSPINDPSGYSAQLKTKNCNPCDKTPWMPIQQDKLTYLEEASYAPPRTQRFKSLPNNEYLPSGNHEVLHDVHFAASQEVRAPDYSFVTPNGQDFNVPVPGPHLYPGAIPPLFEPEKDFNLAQVISNKNPGYFEASLSPVFENSDLSSSDTQVSNDHTIPTAPSGFSDDYPDNTNQVKQNPTNIYEISGLDQESNEHPYDVSSNVNVAEGSYAPSNGSSGIVDSINVEESPVLDFTSKGESRLHTSPIPSTSNAFMVVKSDEIAGTTVAPGDEIFGTRQGITSTESNIFTIYKTTDILAKESRINNSTTQDSLYSTSHREQDIVRDILKDYYDEPEVNFNETSIEQQGVNKNKQIQVIIPYTSQYTPLPFQPSKSKISDTDGNNDRYVGEESHNRLKVVIPPSNISQSWLTTLAMSEDVTRKPIDKADNSIDEKKLQKNIDNWIIQQYSKNDTKGQYIRNKDTMSFWSLLGSSETKKIPDTYLTKHVNHINDSLTVTLTGFSFNDQAYEGSTSSRVKRPQIQVKEIEKSTESSTDTSTSSTKDMIWQDFPVGISSVNRERVYIVTPQPSVTTKSYPEYRKEKAWKEAERNVKELKKALETDTKKTEKSDTFESIEKAYQVLPQAVNNLAVASTGPESVPLWGIMEHEELASPDDSEYDNKDTEPPMLYSRFLKKSRARR